MLTTLSTTAAAAEPPADPAASQQQEPPAAVQQPALILRTDGPSRIYQGTANSQVGNHPHRPSPQQQPNSAAEPQGCPPPPPLLSPPVQPKTQQPLVPVSKARLVHPKAQQLRSSRPPPEPPQAPARPGGTPSAQQQRAPATSPVLRFSFSENQGAQQQQPSTRRAPTQCTARSTRDQAYKPQMRYGRYP